MCTGVKRGPGPNNTRLSGKEIGWLGDGGRKGGRLVVGMSPCLQNLVQSSAISLKIKVLYSQGFYSPGFPDHLEEVGRNLALKKSPWSPHSQETWRF